MLNKAILNGRLTKAPELKQTNSGKSVCSFTIAVDYMLRRFYSHRAAFLLGTTGYIAYSMNGLSVCTRRVCPLVLVVVDGQTVILVADYSIAWIVHVQLEYLGVIQLAVLRSGYNLDIVAYCGKINRAFAHANSGFLRQSCCSNGDGRTFSHSTSG